MWIENNNNNKNIEIGTVGELYVSGNNVSLGYSNNYLDLKKGDLNKGILKTGDLAFKDQDGFFYIKGRTKRIAKIYGNRINLDEIEDRMSLIGIKIGCIEKKDTILVFYDDLSLADIIKKKVSEVTGQNKNFFKVFYLNILPRTQSFKINYLALEKVKND